MIGLGTLINACGILIGGLGGLLFGKKLTARYQDTLMSANGICVLFIGISGCLKEIYSITASGLETGGEQDAGFVNGFLTASFTVCIGAMAVVGAIQDGTVHDYSILSAKALLDLIIIMIMTASFGKGCIFSAIPMAVFQGAVTLLATLIQPIMTDQALSNLSLTGNILIFCVGLNLIWGKKIKVANLLPTILFAVIWAFLPIR